MSQRELQILIDQFHKILHLYSMITRKPKDYGTGDKLYFTEVHTISMIGQNNEINVTGLAGMMGVTKSAISQTIEKLTKKELIMRTRSVNNKEVNLSLTKKGLIVISGLESFRTEIFNFASALYEKAGPDDVEMVGRLFTAIIENMQYRVRQESF